MEGVGFEPTNPKERIYSPPRLATSLSLQWRRTESNCRHTELQSVALPTELLRLGNVTTVPTGFEPAISCVTGRRDNRYTTGPYSYSFFNCGDRTRTCDLRVMSPTSCQLLYPAIINKEDVGFEPTRVFTRLTVFKTVPLSRTWVILQKYMIVVSY